MISIAHRLSTIRAASKIIVMKKGGILEQGTHEELLELNGSYADMVRLQTVKAEDGPSSSRASLESRDADTLSDEKQTMKAQES